MRFAEAALKLAKEVSSMVSKREDQKLVEEWNEFFVGSIFPTPLALFVQVAAKKDTPESLLFDLGKHSFAYSIRYIAQWNVFQGFVSL